jgi:hypothetical protein
MSNTDMKPRRFLRWHEARKRVAHIVNNLNAGRTVYLCTPMRAIKLTAKHADMLKATKTGAYVQMGKRWDCIDGCAIKVQ